MKRKCKKCKKNFKSDDKSQIYCPKCEALKKSLKDNQKKVHFFKDAQEIIEENKMSLSYGKLSIQRDFSTSAGKPSVLKNVIKIPVVLAAEMVQWYRIDELPQWLRDQFPKGQTYVTIFKPYEELEMCLKDLQKIPAIIQHPEGTFLKDLNPYDFEMNSYIKEDEVIGWIKDFYADPKSRSIKGGSYLTISKSPDILLNKLMRGDIIDVSIGFGAVFGGGGTYKHPSGWDEDYELKQQDIRLGHLAILLEGEGKCTVDKCGLNHDHKILIENEKRPNNEKDRSVMGHIINFVDSKVQVKFKLSESEQAVVLNNKEDIKEVNTPDITDIGNDLMPKTEIDILKEQLANAQKDNKKLQEDLSKIKTTELSTQLKDTSEELKITNSAFNKQKIENEEMKATIKDQQKIIDDSNNEKREKIITEIAGLELEDYAVEDIKDKSLCDLLKLQKFATKIKAKLAISGDKSLSLGGLRKPNEEDYENGHKGGKVDKMPSTSFTVADIRKMKEEKEKAEIMADETYDSKHIGDVHAAGSSSTVGGVKVGDAFGPGDAIRIVAGVAYITASGDALLTGVAASKPGHDNDAVFTVGEIIEYYPIGQDTTVHMKLEAAAGPIAVEEGEVASLSATDGQVQKFAYTDAAVATDTLILKVGRFAEPDAGHATEVRIVKVNLSG